VGFGVLTRGEGLALFVFFDEAVDEGDQLFAGAGKDEGTGGGVPVQLETGGQSGDPDLADGRVGGDDELGGRFFKDNVENAALLFYFEAGFVFFFAGDEVLLECVECAFGGAAEFEFVLHEFSLATAIASEGQGASLLFDQSDGKQADQKRIEGSHAPAGSL
jgi:hypothetical protein